MCCEWEYKQIHCVMGAKQGYAWIARTIHELPYDIRGRSSSSLPRFWFRQPCTVTLKQWLSSLSLWYRLSNFSTRSVAIMIIHAPSVPTIIGALSFMLLLNVLAIFLRFYARRGLGQRLQADDWLMIPAIIGTFGCAACLFHGMRELPWFFLNAHKEQAFEEDQWAIGLRLSWTLQRTVLHLRLGPIPMLEIG